MQTGDIVMKIIGGTVSNQSLTGPVLVAFSNAERFKSIRNPKN